MCNRAVSIPMWQWLR